MPDGSQRMRTNRSEVGQVSEGGRRYPPADCPAGNEGERNCPDQHAVQSVAAKTQPKADRIGQIGGHRANTQGRGVEPLWPLDLQRQNDGLMGKECQRQNQFAFKDRSIDSGPGDQQCGCCADIAGHRRTTSEPSTLDRLRSRHTIRIGRTDRSHRMIVPFGCDRR